MNEIDVKTPATDTATDTTTDTGTQRHQLLTDGGALSYLEWPAGRGKPPLHFAHANGFNGLTYRHLLAPLSADFHVHAWDARGHGKSTATADPAHLESWRVYVGDLVHLLENLARDSGGPILLAGHSMGGTTSLAVAARRPDLVSGVLFLDPVMPPPFMAWMVKLTSLLGLPVEPNRLAAGAAKRRSLWPSRAAMFEAYHGRGAFRTWPDAMVRDYIEGGTQEGIDAMVELTCAPAWEAANFKGPRFNVWRSLWRLQVPFSLLYAQEGSTCRDEGAAWFRRHDRRATVRRIDASTHFLPMECPDIVKTEVLSLHQRAKSSR